jgi:WD40 repeat protein/serine/threonine protein kinase
VGCLDENLVAALVSGELDAPARVEVEAHLDGCPDCRRLVSAVAQGRVAHASLGATRQEPSEAARGETPTSRAPFGATPRTAAEREPPPLLSPGDLIDHFRVVRLLGRGGMGDVYLARDTKLGRKVAIKVVQPALLGSAEVLERFRIEALATAQFSHPNIVAIHSVGEVAGRGASARPLPYVALEYLTGKSLAERLRERRLALGEAVRIGRAVARGLAEAHRRGVLHRDLKPANVHIGDDGRVRVLDFGLAVIRAADARSLPPPPPTDGAPLARAESPASSRAETDTALDARAELDRVAVTRGTSGAGTPRYMAPEQWRREPATTAADVWALGAVLFEMVVGRPPFVAKSLVLLGHQVCDAAPAPRLETLALVPTSLAALVGRCLAKDAAERPTAAAVATELAAVAEQLQTGRGHAPAAEASPFRGLLPLEQHHAHLFFGRDDELADFVERVRHEPVLTVVGPSGVGKSSLVRAGLVPRLLEEEPWLVVAMRPGAHPLETLAERVVRLEDARPSLPPSAPGGEPTPPDDTARRAERRGLLERLRAAPERLGLELRSAAELHEAPLLLIVDQLEEIFTMVQNEAERLAFATALASAADDPDEPVRVVVTVREDFVGRIAMLPPMRRMVERLAVLAPPGAEAMREMLTRPLEAIGYGYDDPGLVEAMTREVARRPGGLPLLAFAAQQLWLHRDKQGRRLRRSDYEALGGVAGALAHHADAVLDAMSEAEQSTARTLLLRLVTPTRARRTLGRERALEDLGPLGKTVLGRLVDARLVALRRARTGATTASGMDDALLELPHEALLVAWGRLARWIDEMHENVALRTQVEQAAELWSTRGRRGDELWQGEALAETKRLLAGPLTREARAFLEAGREHERRRRRRRRAAAASAIGLSLAVAVASALVAAVLADKEQRARSERDRAERQHAAALRESARAAFAQGRPLEARAKLRAALEREDAPIGRALWWQLAADPLQWSRGLGAAVYDVAVSPDGRTIAVACQDQAVHLFDVSTADGRRLRGHGDQVLSVAFSSDGRALASGDWAGKVRLWDVTSGAAERVLDAHGGPVLSVAFHPSGGRLATGGMDDRGRVWDLATGEPLHELGSHGGLVHAVAFAPGGATLATAGQDRAVRLWDAGTGALRGRLEGHASDVRGLAFSPDGALLASSDRDGAVRLWRVATGREERVLRHPASAWRLGFAKDGAWLVTGASDGLVRVWETATGSVVTSLRASSGQVRAVGTHARGTLVAGADIVGSLGLWDAAVAPLATAEEGHAGGVTRVRVSADGRTLVSSGYDKTARIWDVAAGAEERTLAGHEQAVGDVDVSPEGDLVATAGYDGTVRLWQRESGRPIAVLHAHGSVLAVAFSPDGARVASGGADRTVRLWDVPTRREVARLEGHGEAVHAVAFSRDGRWIASAGTDDTARIWRTDDGRLERVLAQGADVWSVAFDAASERLFVADHDGNVKAWGIASAEPALLARAPARLLEIAVAPDGRFAGAATDGRAYLWSATGGEPLVLGGHRGEVNSVAFDPTAGLVATGGDDGTVRLFEAASGRPRWGRSGGDCPLDTPAGCVVVAPDRVTIGGALLHEGRAHAAGWDGSHVLVATDRDIAIIHPATRATSLLAAAPGVTALVGGDGWLVVGHRDGQVTRVDRRAPDKTLGFAETPASPVTLVRPAPGGTLLVGFGNGLMGLWDRASGARLRTARLHGAIDRLRSEGARVEVATDLGRSLSWDLGTLERPYCDLLSEIWERVPVLWGEEGAVLAPRPDHACASGRRNAER